MMKQYIAQTKMHKLYSLWSKNITNTLNKNLQWTKRFMKTNIQIKSVDLILNSDILIV